MAYLDIETPDGGRRVALGHERVRIGRLATNDVVLAFPQVSRQHAELQYVNGQWWISDLGSTNGVQIDARRIHDHALRDGDQIILAPGVSLRFHDAAGADRPLAASGPLWQDSPAPRRPGAHSHPLSNQPTAPAPWPFLPAASAKAPPLTPGTAARGPTTGADPAAPVWRVATGPERAPAPESPIDPSESDAYGSIAWRAGAGGGYPAPPGPLHSGAAAEGDDPYRRESAASEAGRATAGPATLLHVCQTCGQRTSPGSIYCQHCHNPIASECPNCRLSLLPIQERCPRCHTPNAHSVRRAQTRNTMR
jgi:hypothetical protein